MIENFVAQNASWKVVALSLVFYGVLLWVPPNLAYVLVGRSKVQILQFRLALLGSIFLAVSISVFNFTQSYLILILALCNWLLLVWVFFHRDNLESKP